MIDSEMQTKVEVLTEGGGYPNLMIPLSQLPEVSDILKRHGIPFWVAQDAIQIDDKPIIAFVNFAVDADAALIQAVLDAG